MDKTIDVIRTDRIERFEKLFFYLALATAVIAVLKILFEPSILTGQGSLADYIISLLPIFMYINFRKKTSSRNGQFIKWTKDSVEFKSRDSEHQILISDIQDVKIALDTIDLILKDGSTMTINIEDYTNYDDRLRIKGNFEKLLTTPNSR